MASAILNMVSSDPSPLKELTAKSTKRQLEGVYPAVGFFLSILGNKLRLFCPYLSSGFANFIPVISQYPVHRFLPQLKFKVLAIPFLAALFLVDLMRLLHG